LGRRWNSEIDCEAAGRKVAGQLDLQGKVERKLGRRSSGDYDFDLSLSAGLENLTIQVQSSRRIGNAHGLKPDILSGRDQPCPVLGIPGPPAVDEASAIEGRRWLEDVVLGQEIRRLSQINQRNTIQRVIRLATAGQKEQEEHSPESPGGSGESRSCDVRGAHIGRIQSR
jgi:hypothetical protein